MHHHNNSNIPTITSLLPKLSCRTSARQRDGISRCVTCSGPLYDGSRLDMSELVEIIAKNELVVPRKLYRNKSGSIQTVMCPILRIRHGLKQIILGFLALVVGLATPGVLNWLVASARDVTMFS
jgi:hypothetical protein